eukprot:g9278.t1
MFCSVCGVHTMGVPRGTPEEGGISINVHCLDTETIDQVHVSYIPGDHFVADVEPAITTRATLSKGVISKSADVQKVFSSDTEMASRWLTGTEQQIKELARTPEVIRMNSNGIKHAKTKSTQKKMSGQNRYMRNSTNTPTSSSLIHTLVHGTAQATAAAASAAASTLNDVAKFTSTLNQQHSQRNDFNNNSYDNSMYIINDENNNENMMNVMPASRTGRSFSTGSNVDDIKNQLQRYLKKYPEKNTLTTSFNTKTPLKRSTRY